MSRILVYILSALISVSTYGQGYRQYAFARYSTMNGLLTNLVTSIAQDKEGYIWMASSNGLQRFDGNNFLTFKSTPGDPNSLPANDLIRLHVDKHFNLWVITKNNRLGIFNTRTFKFKEVRLNRLSQRNVFSGITFFETPAGLYYNEGSGDLYRFEETVNSFLAADADMPHPVGWNRLSCSYSDEDNCLWMTSDSGIAMYDLRTKQLNFRGHNVINNAVIKSLEKEKMVLGVHSPSGNSVYFVTWPTGSGVPNLIIGNKITGTVKRHLLNNEIGLGYHEIGGVFQQHNGRTWVFGKPFFAEIINDGNSFTTIPNEYKNEQSIRFDVVSSIFEDRSGNIWFGTDNGVFLFNPDAQHFHVHNLQRPTDKLSFEAPVQTVLEMDDGNYLVGCWGKGLYMYDKNFSPLTLPKILQHNMDVLSIWDMHKHSRTGKIWMVMQAGEILVYDPATRTREVMKPEVFQNRTIRKIVEDKAGNLWFGHQGGRIIKWDFQASGGDVKKGFVVVQNSGAAYELFVDKLGFVWVGTMAWGLHKIDPVSGKIIITFKEDGTNESRIFNNFPNDIVQYDDTTILVTAGCINIINTKTNKVTYFSTDEGLPSNTAKCIEIDSGGILWVGMENGLCRINFKKKIVNTYDRRDGITFDNFGEAACKKLSGGRLAFMTDHNFMVFDPAKLIPAASAASPLITSFKLGGKFLLVDSLFNQDGVELSYDNTAIEVEFSGLTYLKQDRLHYHYMLDDIDKTWREADATNRVVYNYLAPGNYLFKLKAINSNGEESAVKEFKVQVSPPFWKSWWFLGVCMLTVLAVLFRIDRERMNRFREVQQTRASIAGNLHHDIHTTLNNINILSEMAKMKVDKDIVRSKEYIHQISEKSHDMIIAMDDMLWSIDPQNDVMEGTLLRTREFIDSLQSRHEAKIVLAIDDKVRSLELDMKVRHEFFLMLKMILRLIAEDAGGKEMQLNIDNFKSKLVLKVSGDNVAININHPTIVQKIEEIKKRAASIKAVIDIQNDPTGISVILIVKL